jgi:hypothetical protein
MDLLVLLPEAFGSLVESWEGLEVSDRQDNQLRFVNSKGFELIPPRSESAGHDVSSHAEASSGGVPLELQGSRDSHGFETRGNFP